MNKLLTLLLVSLALSANAGSFYITDGVTTNATGIVDASGDYHTNGIYDDGATPSWYSSGIFAGYYSPWGMVDASGNGQGGGILDSEGTFKGTTGILNSGTWGGLFGILDGSGNYAMLGILDNTGAAQGDGILELYGTYHANGIYDDGATPSWYAYGIWDSVSYYANGIFDDSVGGRDFGWYPQGIYGADPLSSTYGHFDSGIYDANNSAYHPFGLYDDGHGNGGNGTPGWAEYGIYVYDVVGDVYISQYGVVDGYRYNAGIYGWDEGTQAYGYRANGIYDDGVMSGVASWYPYGIYDDDSQPHSSGILTYGFFQPWGIVDSSGNIYTSGILESHGYSQPWGIIDSSGTIYAGGIQDYAGNWYAAGILARNSYVYYETGVCGTVDPPPSTDYAHVLGGGTLSAANIGTLTGTTNLIPEYLKAGIVVDDVTGTLSAGAGGGGINGAAILGMP